MTNQALDPKQLKADALAVLSGIVSNPNAYLARTSDNVLMAVLHARELDKQIDDLVEGPRRAIEAAQAQARLVAARAEAEAKEAEDKARHVREAAERLKKKSEVPPNV